MEQLFNQAKRYADYFGYELPESLTEAGQVQNFDEFVVHLHMERVLQDAKDARNREKRVAEQKKQLKDWRLFKKDYLRTYDGLDYLRFDVKTGQVETTQSVRFSLSAAHQLYQFVMATNAKGGCLNCRELFLERYLINEVNKHFIRIGCHKVTLKEIQFFAK